MNDNTKKTSDFYSVYVTDTANAYQTYCAGQMTQNAQQPAVKFQYTNTFGYHQSKKSSLFFTTSTNVCPFQSCSIYQYSDCSTAIDSSHMIVTPIDVKDFRIDLIRNIAGGFTYEICFKCTDSYSNSIQNSYSWSATLYDCSNCLTLPAPFTIVTPYDANTAKETLIPQGSWNTFFSNKYTSDCPVSGIRLYPYTDGNCDSFQYSGNKLNQKTSSPFGIEAKKNIAGGYTEVVCVQVDAGTVSQYQTLMYAALTVQLSTSSCSTDTLTSRTYTDQTIAYSLAEANNPITMQPDGDWETFFANSDTTNCPITACELTQYTGGACTTNSYSISKITMASSTPWAITINRNDKSGWVKNFCVQCKTDKPQYAYINNWTVTLTSTCPTSLTSRSNSLTNTISYSLASENEVSTIQPDGSWETFFSNSDTTNCPITSCGLYKYDSATSSCLSSSFSTTDLSIGSSSPWAITAKKLPSAGYSHTFCVKCSNGAQDAYLNSLTVTLNNQCPSSTLTANSATDKTINYEFGGGAQTVSPTSSAFTSWDDHFSNTNPSNCGITSCTIWQAGGCGTTAFSGTSDLYIDASSPWALKAHTSSNVLGWTHKICLRCTNGYQNVDIDNWTITLTSGCLTSMSSTNTMVSHSLVYSSVTLTEEIQPITNFTTWDAFFNNQDSGNCGITGCTLYDVSVDPCGTTAYAGTEVVIAASSPWAVTAKRDSNAGYSVSLCVRCVNNGPQTIDSNTWAIAQTIKCLNSLQLPQPEIPAAKTLDFGQSSSIQPSSSFVNWDTFFSNQDVVNCPITSCTICNSGTSYITIDSSSPWSLSAKTNVASGYSQSLCVQCNNILESAKLEGWVITQKAEPTSAPLYVVVIEEEEEVPPSFAETLQGSQDFQFESEDQTFTFNLPDLAQEQTSISFSGYEFVTYNQGQNSIELQPSEGKHTLQITLTGQSGLTKSYSISLNFFFTQPEKPLEPSSPIFKREAINQAFKSFNPQQKPEEEQMAEEAKRKPIELIFESFTQNGQLTLVFSEKLEDEAYFEILGLNTTFINDNIQGAIELNYTCRGSDEEESQDAFPRLMSYRIQNWTQTYMTFKLEFSKPLYVSTFGSLDYVDLRIMQNSLFMSIEDKLLIAEFYSLIKIPVPTQMASEEDFLQVQGMGSDSQNAMLLTLIVPFCFMLFMSFSMNKVWALYNMMQLITNIKNYKTMMIPANLMLMLEVIENIVNFNFLENQFIQTWLKNHVFGKVQWLQNILVGQGMFVTSGIAVVVGIGIVLVFIKVPKTRDVMTKLKHKLMWSSLFRSQIQTYLPTCIVILMKLQRKDQSWIELIQTIIIIFLPLISYQILSENLDRLEEPQFQQMYGTLYQNLDTKKDTVTLFQSFFMIRRFLVAMSTTSGDSHLITNIYVNIFTSLALIKFYIERKPMQDKTSNTLEIINECFTLGSFYSMFVFTDFVPEIETRYRTGFKAIYLFLIVSIVNIFSIFYQLAQHVRIQYLKKRYMKAWTAHYELEGRMNDYIIYQCIKRDIKVTQKQVEELTFEQKKQKIDQLNDQNCHDITFLDVMGIQGQDENKKVDESTGTPRFKKVEIIDQQKFNNIIELNMLEREVEFDQLQQLESLSFEEIEAKMLEINERYAQQILTARNQATIEHLNEDPAPADQKADKEDLIKEISFM